MDFLNSPLAGCLILLVAMIAMVVFSSAKSKRDYEAAMKKYEEDMAAYEIAVAQNSGTVAYGVAFAPPDITMEATSDAVASYFGPASKHFGSLVKAVGGNYDVELVGVDERTAAMVIAILCEQLGGDVSRLQFHSIKAV